MNVAWSLKNFLTMTFYIHQSHVSQVNVIAFLILLTHAARSIRIRYSDIWSSAVHFLVLLTHAAQSIRIRYPDIWSSAVHFRSKYSLNAEFSNTSSGNSNRKTHMAICEISAINIGFAVCFHFPSNFSVAFEYCPWYTHSLFIDPHFSFLHSSLHLCVDCLLFVVISADWGFISSENNLRNLPFIYYSDELSGCTFCYSKVHSGFLVHIPSSFKLLRKEVPN